MDAIDGAILRELTADARLPFRELGTRVGLSANAAAARVRRLQEDGTIRGFTIVTSTGGPLAVGPGSGAGSGGGAGAAGGGAGSRSGLEVFIEVRLAPETTNDDFTAALTRPPGFPQVLDAVHVTGSYDYLLHATVADPTALDHLVRRLKREAGAAQTFTRLALRGPTA
jgi:Lrp/AsnC family leucine-responsive transcriptional regulator